MQTNSVLNKKNKIVIIGGGISGLASAALLGKVGWQVTLFEKNKTLGGRARVLKSKGFSFDMGPSWYMMPEVFERFFNFFNKKTEDFYTLVRLSPRYKVQFEDGDSVVISDNKKNYKDWFEQKEIGSQAQLDRYLLQMKNLYLAATEHLVYQDVWNFKAWFRRKNVKALIKLFTTIRIWESWDDQVSRYFKSSKIKKILEFPSVFLGGSPYNTPSLYSLLSWADFGTGVWYPKGGMGKIVTALEKLAIEYGVEIKKGAEVTQIMVQNHKVSGVFVQEQFYPADMVIGVGDLYHIQTNLLPRQYRDNTKKWKDKTLGISALVLYLGIHKRIKNLHHHTLYFSDNWAQNFDQIFKQHKLPTHPSFYISARSVTDRSIVPKGSEELFVLVPIAASLKYSKKQLSQFSDKVITQVEQVVGTEIKQHLVVKKIFSPADFARDYNAYNGTALGLAHTLKQSLFGRPHNKSNKIKGLFFTGQYTNPGVGVPMALISAQIVAEMIGKPKVKTAEIFRRGSTTYYYSSLFFRGQVKKDVFTLYAYVRTIDDLVDSVSPQKKEFKYMWAETKKAWEKGSSNNPIVKNFIELAKRKNFKWEWIEGFWSAMRSDLQGKKYASFKQLEEYMFGSAEVVGLMMANILDLPKAAYKTARLQGKAMQYVNFIRDFAEDKTMGRNYLGISAKVKPNSKRWNESIKKAIDQYFEIQQEAEEGYKHLPKKYLIPIKTAADMYTWTSKQIYNNPQIVWEKKIKPSKFRVVFQLLKNAITV